MSAPIEPLDIVLFGLSITSSWGNGHATTYRALARALHDRGHRVRFYERDTPWYAANRDLPRPPWCRITLYQSLAQLQADFPGGIGADLVVIGSYVPEAVSLARWVLPRTSGVTAFYDIDTPVTLAGLERGACEYLTSELVPQFDLYLSFAGGPVLERLRTRYGANLVRPLYCSVDPDSYFPEEMPRAYDLAYLGTYSADRQARLEELLNVPAHRWPKGRFCVAGSKYPGAIEWAPNVARIEHLEPSAHRRFYNSQRFALNVTRADMVANGFSPSVRLFEAAACGVPIITDEWCGLGDFFTPGREILVARSAADTLEFLRELDEASASALAGRARSRVLAAHTAQQRALELESYVQEVRYSGVDVAYAS